MSNMSYCRFQNTKTDLLDCEENMENIDIDEDEARARKSIIKICKRIVDDYREELEDG